MLADSTIEYLFTFTVTQQNYSVSFHKTHMTYFKFYCLPKVARKSINFTKMFFILFLSVMSSSSYKVLLNSHICYACEIFSKNSFSLVLHKASKLCNFFFHHLKLLLIEHIKKNMKIRKKLNFFFFFN